MTTDSPSTLPAISERFLIVLDQLGLTGYAIAKQGEVAESTISHIRTGKQKPSIDVIEWLLGEYPQVNADFVLRGVGEPLGVGSVCQVNHGTVAADGIGNNYNYKPSIRHVQQSAQLQTENEGLKRENALLNELLAVYRKSNGVVGND